MIQIRTVGVEFPPEVRRTYLSPLSQRLPKSEGPHIIFCADNEVRNQGVDPSLGFQGRQDSGSEEIQEFFGDQFTVYYLKLTATKRCNRTLPAKNSRTRLPVWLLVFEWLSVPFQGDHFHAAARQCSLRASTIGHSRRKHRTQQRFLRRRTVIALGGSDIAAGLLEQSFPLGRHTKTPSRRFRSHHLLKIVP